MRWTNDAKGSGVGRDWFCFKCGAQGHFARDCPALTKQEKDARPRDELGQRLQDKAAQSAKAVIRGRFVDRNRGGGPRAGAHTRSDTAANSRRDATVDNRCDRQWQRNYGGAISWRADKNRSGQDDRSKNGYNGTARTR